MTIQTTNQASLSPTMQTYYDKKLLSRLLPELVHLKFAQKKPIPKNGGKSIKFRKFTALAHATTPLTEGVKPEGKGLNMTEINATVEQYGDFIEISDLLDLTAIDPVLDESAELLGEQAAQTLDVIARDVLLNGTSVQYANGKASRAGLAVGDNLTVDEVRKARRSLKRANVKPVAGNDYIAFIEPGTAFDLMSDPKWEEPNKYKDSAKAIIDGEIGRLYGVRFIETSFAKKFEGAGTGGVDVYGTLVFGKDFYGMSDVDGSGAVKNIVKPHGSAGSSDPLDQIATSGWKALFCVERLEELAAVRIEHTVSG
jgi:N4-gp56 family major capsid protein